MLATKYGVFKGHVADSFHYFSMSDISEQPRKKQKVDHLVSQLREVYLTQSSTIRLRICSTLIVSIYKILKLLTK